MSETDIQLTPASSEMPSVRNIIRTKFSKQTIENQKWHSLLFDDLNALEATFENCDFSYSIFRRGYFRKCTFTNCVFVGCKFYDCNLRGATFYKCELKYANFHRCQVEVEEIIPALPFEPNIRREALQSLRANASEIGDFASQRVLVLEEIEATKEHHRRALRGSDSYYRQKYGSILAKVSAGWNLLWLNISGVIWGNGEKPRNILWSAATILLALTIINFWSVMPRVGWAESGAGLRVLQYTTSLFLDLPTDDTFRGFLTIDYVIAAMRYLYIGLYVSVLYKTISHR